MAQRKKAEPKDPWLEGYRLGVSQLDVTPEWYRWDEEKQRRRSGKNLDGSWRFENTPPTGIMKIDLSDSVYDSTILPPFATWYKGVYASEKDVPPEVLEKIATADQWETWVVDGEGTPGNWIYRAYTLPSDVAKNPTPPHPSKWPKKKKETGYSYGYGTKPAASSLPASMLIRCMGCGHWYTESKLKDHVTAACPGTQGGSTEWVIPCSCCGENIDAMAVCKKGFPKQTKKPDAVAIKVETPEPASAA